jgi:hypothetical protein
MGGTRSSQENPKKRRATFQICLLELHSEKEQTLAKQSINRNQKEQKCALEEMFQQSESTEPKKFQQIHI